MSEILLVNPRRRRRRKTSTRKKVARKRNPSRKRRVGRVKRRRVSRRRRNPSFRAAGIKGQLKTAATGAAGAIALDIALAYIPVPATLKGGIIGKVVKGAAAIGLGIVANKVGVSAANANKMTEGALTVQLAGIGRELLGQFAPNIALSAYLDEGLGYYGSGWNPNAVDDPDALGAYLPDLSSDGMTIPQDGLAAYWNPGDGYDDFYG